MNQNYLPPLLRGIGTTIVLVATIASVIVACGNVRAEQTKREAVRTRMAAQVKALPVAAQSLAELIVEVQDLKSGEQEESMVEEALDNPWFAYASLVGMAVIAGSFFLEAYLRRCEKD